MTEIPFRSQGTLLIVTDWKDSDFVKECAGKLEESALAAKWELRWVEVGQIGMTERLNLLARLAEQIEISAAMYVHLSMTPGQAEFFRLRKIPLGCLASRYEGVHWVAADERAGGAKVASEFARLKHQRIAVIAGPQDSPECQERVEGFLIALSTLGHDPATVSISRTLGFGPKDGHLAMQKLLPPRGPYPTAVFAAAGDLVAQGAMQALGERNLNVPRDLSLVGYDNLPFTETMNPPLSTVRQPLQAMASRLFQTLVTAAIMGNASTPSTQSVTPIFVPRKSCAVPLATEVPR